LPYSAFNITNAIYPHSKGFPVPTICTPATPAAQVLPPEPFAVMVYAKEFFCYANAYTPVAAFISTITPDSHPKHNAVIAIYPAMTVIFQIIVK
jgi:hypothetical protein